MGSQKEVGAYCIRPHKQKIKKDRMNPIFIEMTNVDTVLKVNLQTLLLTLYFIVNILKKLSSNIFCLVSILAFPR